MVCSETNENGTWEKTKVPIGIAAVVLLTAESTNAPADKRWESVATKVKFFMKNLVY